MRFVRIAIISGTVMLILIAPGMYFFSLPSSIVDQESDLPRATNSESTSKNNDESHPFGKDTSPIYRLVEGYVIDPWGKSVSGIKLRISSENKVSNEPANANNQVISNAKGYFQFEPEQADRYLITTDETAVYKPSASNISRKTPKIQIELTLKDRILLSGQVTDTRGIPVPGAIISGRYDKKLDVTDSVGRFQIDIGISKFGGPKISVVRGGYQSAFLDLDRKHYIDKQEIDITLEFSDRTMTVHGWIGNTNGQALPGQRIELFTPSKNKYKSNAEDYFTYSNVDGFFEIEGVIVDSTYQLEVSPESSHQKLINPNVYISSSMAPLSIILSPLKLHSITGVVTDFDLNPLSNITMSINSEVSARYTTRFITDDAGQFYIEHFPVGRTTFRTGRSPFHKIGGIEIKPSQGADIKVPIDQGRLTFSGRINSIDGNPLIFTLVELKANFNQDGVISNSNRKTFTDADGYFEFENLGRGPHDLTVYSRGQRIFQRNYDIDSQSVVEHISIQ